MSGFGVVFSDALVGAELFERLRHQNLSQFESSLRGTVMASTSIKMVGGLSAKDAGAFAKEMCCEPEFLQGMRKRRDHTEFACFVRNHTEHPIPLTVPFGRDGANGPSSARPSTPHSSSATVRAMRPPVMLSTRRSRPAPPPALARRICSKAPGKWAPALPLPLPAPPHSPPYAFAPCAAPGRASSAHPCRKRSTPNLPPLFAGSFRPRSLSVSARREARDRTRCAPACP